MKNEIHLEQNNSLNHYHSNEFNKKNTKPNSKLKFFLKCTGSLVIGVGSGLAMMPIFNEEVKKLENFDIDIHANEWLFLLSTINTLIVYSLSAVIFSYNYTFAEKPKLPTFHKDQPEYWILKFAEVGSVCSSFAPCAMLWKIEIENQKISESSGFDQFIAWATFTCLPLLFYKSSLVHRNIIDSIKEHDLFKTEVLLNTTGSKIITYGIPIIALVPRGVALTSIFEDFFKIIPFLDSVSLPLGIITGGICANSINAVSEFQKLKSMFAEKNSYEKKELAFGILSAVEGLWFAAPQATVALKAMEGWNVLIKGILDAIYYIQHFVYEACEMFETFIFTKASENNADSMLLGEAQTSQVNTDTFED